MAASDHLSPEQFGMRHAANEEHPFDTHDTEEMGYRRVDLQSAKFVSTEPKLDKGTVEHYRKHPYKNLQDEGAAANPAQVVEHAGELWLHDGNHRTAAALARGQKSMYFNYLRTKSS